MRYNIKPLRFDQNNVAHQEFVDNFVLCLNENQLNSDELLKVADFDENDGKNRYTDLIIIMSEIRADMY